MFSTLAFVSAKWRMPPSWGWLEVKLSIYEALLAESKREISICHDAGMEVGSNGYSLHLKSYCRLLPHYLEEWLD